MKKLTGVLLAVIVASGPVAAAEWKEVRIATEGAFAPWNFKDASGKLIGFELDLARDLCSRMKVECEIVEQAWDGMIPALVAGKYDVIMAGMSITEKRKKKITFSRTYAATPAMFVVTKDSPSSGFDTPMDAVNLDDVSAGERETIDAVVKEFKGKTIGVQTATTHENFLREYMGKDVEIRTYDTQENLDLDLQAGRVDAALASASYWVPLLKSGKGKNMAIVGPRIRGGPFGAGVGAGVRQENADLAGMLSKAISAAIADGTTKKLAEKWFGFDASTK